MISVAANVVPGEMHELALDWLKGDAKKSLDAQLKYLPLIRLLFNEVSPIPVKAALSMMGRIENTLRLPLCPLDGDRQERLRRELKRLVLVD